MSELDFFGHCFYALIFAGMWFLKNKSPIGWQYRLAGEIGWLGIGAYLGLSSIWIWSLVFIYMDLQGYKKWRDEERLQEEFKDIIAINNSNPGEIVMVHRSGMTYKTPVAYTKFGIPYNPCNHEVIRQLWRHYGQN